MCETSANYSQICPKCGKFIVPPTIWHSTLPPETCTCFEETVFPSKGWICPKCGIAVSPFVNTCPSCSKGITINYTINTF
jgi:uncharacterized OB-fold protein